MRTGDIALRRHHLNAELTRVRARDLELVTAIRSGGGRADLGPGVVDRANEGVGQAALEAGRHVPDPVEVCVIEDSPSQRAVGGGGRCRRSEAQDEHDAEPNGRRATEPRQRRHEVPHQADTNEAVGAER